MNIPVFFAPPENVIGETVTLPTEESRHLAKVMRLKTSTVIMIVDGLGMAYRAEVAKIGRTEVTARVHSVQRNFGEPVVRLTLAAGMSVGSKFDSVVEKGTELGVKRFVPVSTSKSKLSLDTPRRSANKIRRWEKVALAAMKQCRRSYRPEISTPVSFEEFLSQVDPDDSNVILHPSASAIPMGQARFDPETRRVTLLVGPESGFTEDEVAAAVSAGFACHSLGQRILRTQTAGPVAAALLMNALGELR